MNSDTQFKEEIWGKELNYFDLRIRIKDGKELMLDTFRKEIYADLIIPNESYHRSKYKMAALNDFAIGNINV